MIISIGPAYLTIALGRVHDIDSSYHDLPTLKVLHVTWVRAKEDIVVPCGCPVNESRARVGAA